MTPDVNVLVAASRSDHPHHRVARSWLKQAASAAGSGSTLILMPMVLASFLRLKVCTWHRSALSGRVYGSFALKSS
jgi:predicted nucleic acid-binding protein